MPGDDQEGVPVAPIHPMRAAHPLIFEINTWPWLAALSAHHGRPVGLGDVPAADWDAIAALGFDTVWLMGVWERSPAGVAIALANDGLMEDFRATLADFTPDDVVGSPYCVRRYVVDEHLGGPEGLAAARAALAERGVSLVLDFVPNHVAPDHPWTRTHPEYFVAGTADDLERDPAAFVAVGDRVLANGKDPYFAAWPDVVQLDAFSPALRAAAIDTLVEIGAQCDGVRCDMAMLMMNATFARTWGDRVGPAPTDDFWPTVIPAVRRTHPAFTFIAEAYWDLEWGLQRQHFDYCYDKRLYDRLVAAVDGTGDAEAVRGHLHADLDYQRGLLRFVENHDEPRAAATFPPEAERAAVVAALSQTGARLVHQGQATGRRAHLPVFLGRFPDEPLDADLQAFHTRLLAALSDDTFREGNWQLCDVGGWPGDDSWAGLVSWCWSGDARWLVVVNLSAVTATGHVAVPWADVHGREWRLTDPTHPDPNDAAGTTSFDRDGDDLADGMFVSLPPWQWHFCRVDPLPDPPADQSPTHANPADPETP